MMPATGSAAALRSALADLAAHPDSDGWTEAELLFGRKSGRHTHPVTHPVWMEFEDGGCIVCGNKS